MTQQTAGYIGSWEGTLSVGVDLRIIFHVKSDGQGNLVSTADSPDQAAFGIPCDSTYIANQLLNIRMNALNAGYTGKLVNDTLIEGMFTQGQEFPLTLKKLDKPTERNRPQNPKGPFAYKSEEVMYPAKDPSIQLAGTITIPDGKGPFPAALLITGSGPQDRNEELMGHKPFEVLADYLSREGYIVLRVDDRGIGKSTGMFAYATSVDFAGDASAGVDYLLTRPEVNRKKIGLIGHSEGGMIAPMIATSRKDIDFIVLLAGPGVKITELMAEQNAAILRSSKVSADAIAAYIPLYDEVVSQIRMATDSAAAYKAAETLLESWTSKTDAKIISEMKMDGDKNKKKFLSAMAGQISSPWFKYFLSFDPQPYLEKLKCKVLAINGDKDIQVISSQNLPAIAQALKKAKPKVWEVKALPGLNHLFQTCKQCTFQEYAELEETFSPVALNYIGVWLNKNVK